MIKHYVFLSLSFFFFLPIFSSVTYILHLLTSATPCNTLTPYLCFRRLCHMFHYQTLACILKHLCDSPTLFQGYLNLHEFFKDVFTVLEGKHS